MKLSHYLSKLEEKIGLSPYENNSLVPPSKFFKRMALENLLISAGISAYHNLTRDTMGSSVMVFFLIYNLARWNYLGKKLFSSSSFNQHSPSL